MQALYEIYRPKTWDELVGHKQMKVSIPESGVVLAE